MKEGWYDHHLGSAIRTWEILPEATKQKSVFEIGPWNHAYMPCIDHQCTDSLKDTSMSTPLLWFDKVLRKEKVPEGEVRLYRIGADKWDILKEFPYKSDNALKFYLDSREVAGENKKQLLLNPSSVGGNAVFTYDPEDPLFSKGAESTFHSMSENGSHLQEGADYRPDVLTFISEPLTENVKVCGKIKAKLFVSSDCEDTAFSVKICEVFADGEAYNVRGSITTLAYRNDTPHRITYNPGEKVEIEINTWDIDWEFKAGSKIRLDISSSDFPQYSAHSNYPGVWALQEKTKKAHQTIFTGGDYSSYIVFPRF